MTADQLRYSGAVQAARMVAKFQLHVSLYERLYRLGFTTRRDDLTSYDHRLVVFHAETYDILGRLNYDETAAFVGKRGA